jgi:hypothetical protein
VAGIPVVWDGKLQENALPGQGILAQ